MPKHCTTKPRQLPARPRGLALRLASWEYSSGRGRRAKPRPTPRTASWGQASEPAPAARVQNNNKVQWGAGWEGNPGALSTKAGTRQPWSAPSQLLSAVCSKWPNRWQQGHLQQRPPLQNIG